MGVARFFSNCFFSVCLEINKPPVAKIAGNVVITLPTNTAELDGSKSSDDKGIVSYLWTRDEGSPAAGVRFLFLNVSLQHHESQ